MTTSAILQREKLRLRTELELPGRAMDLRFLEPTLRVSDQQNQESVLTTRFQMMLELSAQLHMVGAWH
jgi:hypothetical protein